MAIKVQHREEQESILQTDEFFSKWLLNVMENHDNLVLHIFGDHGNIYHGQHLSHFGGHIEVLNPFSALILPRKYFDKHPELVSTLQYNQDKYVTHYDFHLTMKSLLHFPNLERASGHVWNKAVNLLTTKVDQQRNCEDAGVPEYGCLCSKQETVGPEDFGSWFYTSLVAEAIQHINVQHSVQTLYNADPHNRNETSCMDVQFWKYLNIIRQVQGDTKARKPRVIYHLLFATQVGPSVWHAVVDEAREVISVKQKSRYAKYSFCKDPRVSIEFCICHQFANDEELMAVK